MINPPIDLNMLVPNFTLPVTLRLHVMHILWSGPQNIRNRVHLEYLNLCESIHDLIATPQTWPASSLSAHKSSQTFMR